MFDIITGGTPLSSPTWINGSFAATSPLPVRVPRVVAGTWQPSSDATIYGTLEVTGTLDLSLASVTVLPGIERVSEAGRVYSQADYGLATPRNGVYWEVYLVADQEYTFELDVTGTGNHLWYVADDSNTVLASTSVTGSGSVQTVNVSYTPGSSATYRLMFVSGATTGAYTTIKGGSYTTLDDSVTSTSLDDLIQVRAFLGLHCPPAQMVARNYVLIDGAEFIRRRWLPRPLTIQGVIEGDDWAGLGGVRRAMFDLFNPHTTQLPVTLRYTPLDVDGAELDIDVVYTGGLGQGEDGFIEEATLELLAPAPMWRDPVVQWQEIQIGGNTITNNGSADAYPVIEFVFNTTQTSYITIANSRLPENVVLPKKVVVFNGLSVNAGDALVVDTRPETRQITFNGAEAGNLADPASNLDQLLLPGENEYFILSDMIDLQITIYWQEQHLSGAGKL